MWSSRTVGAEQGSVKCRARLGASVDCARTGWTKARRRLQWAPMAVTALAVGCCGGDGTLGSGLEGGRLRHECRGGEGLKGR